MAYLERLQQGLLGAMQAQNNPSAYLAQRQQQQAMDNQAVQQQYAQAAQQGQASMAQLANEQSQMQAAGQQAIQQKEAEDAKMQQQLLSIGLTLATGGLGGGGAEAGASEAVAESAGNAVAEELGQQAAQQFGKNAVESGAISAADAMTAELGKMGNLTQVQQYRPDLLNAKKGTRFF